MNLAALLVALVGPMAARAIIALGFSALTFTGVTLSANALVTYAQTAWSGIPLDVFMLASLSGIPEFFGMVFGALIARLSMWAVVSSTRYIVSK